MKNTVSVIQAQMYSQKNIKSYKVVVVVEGRCIFGLILLGFWLCGGQKIRPLKNNKDKGRHREHFFLKSIKG